MSTTETKVEAKAVKQSIVKNWSWTTDLFKDRKDVPAFITEHKVFRQPFKVRKIFPSIGLDNFKESCEMTKPMVDLKKENFVTALIQVMAVGMETARDEVMNFGDRIQYLLFGDERDGQLGKVDDVYTLVHLTNSVLSQITTFNNAYERTVQNVEGKIALRLVEDILDRNGKIFFKKNESIFKVFAKIKDRFAAYNLNFINLEQTNEFKTFSSENVANKKYQVIFSSTGSEGAWDILTMSMRGIKSCQRWDGDYPRCLIGSILSQFVGIIYITSGTTIDFSCNLPTGQNITSKGLKMMRRALVRYAIDADEGTPCLIIDKLYPQQQGSEVDEETLKIFKQALASKTKLPIYFGPQLGTKVRHFYVPYEKIRMEVAERDWTYQDTPLKTNLDFQLHILASASNEDITRYSNAFKSKLVVQMGDHFRTILANKRHADTEIVRTVSNIKLNSSFDRFNEQIVNTVFSRFVPNISRSLTDPREYYRKYLIQLILNLKNIRKLQHAHIATHIAQCTSRDINVTTFVDYLFDSLIKNIILQELKSVIN